MANISDGNYTGLVDSTKSWLARSDITNSDVDNFIHLFEAEFNTEMRLRNMEAQTTIGITSGYLVHPDDWREWASIKLIRGQDEVALLPVSEEAAAVDYGQSYLSDPRGYVVRGDRTYIYPQPGSGAWTYKTVYYQKVPTLNTTNTTNWLLTRFPQAYLYGVLLQAQGYVDNKDNLVLWGQAYERTKTAVFVESQRAKFGGGVPYMRPDRWY